MPLREVVPGRIWDTRYPIHLGPFSLTSRMTVVRLEDGSLWVHSPCPASKAVVNNLRCLGQVRYVVAPNRSHHLHFQGFIAHFPAALGYVAPGLIDKVPTLVGNAELGCGPMPWEPEITDFRIDGLPLIGETVFFHRPTNSLIVTDLLFNFSGALPLPQRLLARALGVHEKLAMSRTMRLAIPDRKALARSLEPILELEADRVILAHGEIVQADARRAIAAAFEFLM